MSGQGRKWAPSEVFELLGGDAHDHGVVAGVTIMLLADQLAQLDVDQLRGFGVVLAGWGSENLTPAEIRAVDPGDLGPSVEKIVERVRLLADLEVPDDPAEDD